MRFSQFFVGSHDTITNNPDLFIFQGGTLHEGGSTFALLQVATDTFVINTYPGNGWTSVGVVGDTAVLQHIGEKTIIVCHNSEDNEADTLWMYDSGDKGPMKAYEDLLIQHDTCPYQCQRRGRHTDIPLLLLV